jgi:hypothetical protein
VIVFGLLVKVTGNKLQLYLLTRSKMPFFGTDVLVFWYELVTALLIRVMLLSIPDENTAVLLSLFTAATELMTRTWFFVDYISTGAKERADLGLAGDNRMFRRRGIARVVDGNNDMVVEYVTMAVACAIVVLLPQTGTFDVPTAEVVTYTALARVVGLQVFAEIVVDTFATALEMKGGMAPLHEEYVKSTSAVTVVLQLGGVSTLVTFVIGCLLIAR